MRCSACGVENPSDRLFCNSCGAALSRAASPTDEAKARPAAEASPSAETDSVSIWWLVVPTVIYAYLARNIFTIILVSAVAAGLKLAQKRQEVPARFRPYLPLLQPVVVYDFLGGNITVVVAVAVALVAAARHRLRVIAAFEPWWRLQEQIPRIARMVLAFALPVLVGYYFGRIAGGREWTLTFLSMAVGVGIAFLLLFTPPPSLRQTGAQASP